LLWNQNNCSSEGSQPFLDTWIRRKPCPVVLHKRPFMRPLRVSCRERVNKNSIQIPPIGLQRIILAEKSTRPPEQSNVAR
jgi:hypothetical protein